MPLRAVALCFLVLLFAAPPLCAEMPMDGVRADHILVSTSAPPLDVPVAKGNASVGLIFIGGGLIHGLVAMGIQKSIDKSRTKRHRRYIEDLALDPAMADWAHQFRAEVAQSLQRSHGSETTSVEQFDGDRGRERRELALAPQPVVSARVSITLMPHRDCGSLGVALAWGTAYLKETKDVKRRPIKVYTPKPEIAQALSSEWCLPGSINTHQQRKFGGTKVADIRQLLAILDARKRELLDALATPPVAAIDADRRGTIGPRNYPYYVVSYGRERSWIASLDHEVLRLVPNRALEPFECNVGCTKHDRAMAEERERREQWIGANGPMVYE